MSPYRDRFVTAERAEEPPETKIWRALREQFGDLGPADAWPARQPLVLCRVDTFAMSADGRRAAMTVGNRVHLLDTGSMRVVATAKLARSAGAVAVNGTGSRVVLRVDETLVRWDVGAEPVTAGTGYHLDRAKELAISDDGRIAVIGEPANDAVIRVYDLDACALIYSFRAACYRGFVLHPGGKHLACIGEGGHLVVHGPTGPGPTIARVGGCTFSPDGATLLTTTIDDPHAILRRDFDPIHGALAPHPQTWRLWLELERWTAIRPSPSGRHVLVPTKHGQVAWVDLAAASQRVLDVAFKPGCAIASDERRAFVGPVEDTTTGDRTWGVAIGTCDRGAPLGSIVAARTSPERLVGAVALGLFGALDPEHGPLGPAAGAPAEPYERPERVRAMLGAAGAAPPDAAEQHRLDELAARASAWSGARTWMTVDIEPRQLAAINRGLVHLTPEILRRAAAAGEHAPRFGPVQLTLSALQAAGRELAALSDAERELEFERMIDRMTPPPPSSPEEPAREPPAPPPRWMVALDQALSSDPDDDAG